MENNPIVAEISLDEECRKFMDGMPDDIKRNLPDELRKIIELTFKAGFSVGIDKVLSTLQDCAMDRIKSLFGYHDENRTTN